MKKFVLLILCLSHSIANAVPHKCEINNKIVFQDAPCNGETPAKESEPAQRELFEKVFIGQLNVIKGKESGDYTPVKFEVDAVNNTKNRIQLILKYDGLDNEGLVIDTTTLIGSIDNNSNAKIKNGFGINKRNALLKKIVKWRFNSWKSAIN
ncbi:MAG: hypothetical protein PHQ03_07625 [Methylococcales bacterium]|nr:hypothetical protein [Methylococcales bacterium]